MIQVEKILDYAIAKDASDIHFICHHKPMLRIIRDLVPIEDVEALNEEDMNEIYDYLVRGNIDKDTVYRETKKLDTSLEYGNRRFRVNISLSVDVPVFTLRIIKNELPKFEELGVPDVVRRMTYQPQGLMLVTGKTNSGKTTTLSALIDEINEKQNKKILTLESPIEYKHHSKKSIIVQKETAESGHLVIGTLHTKSCAETIDRMINFYDISDQPTVKYLISSLLKLVISQRLLKGIDGKLVLVPEVMVVDNIVAGLIRKDKISVSEIEDAIQSNLEKGSIGLINSIAELFVKEKITLEH